MIKANYTEKIYSSWIDKEILLNPESYISCEDRVEVIDMVWDNVDSQISYGDVDISDSDRDLDIPDAFWTEWEKLKKENESRI